MYVRNITNVYINFSKNICFTIMSFWQCCMSTHVLWSYWSHNCFFFPFCRYTSCNYLLLYWYSFNDQWVICGLSYGHGWKVMTGPLETYWRLHTCRCLYQHPLNSGGTKTLESFLYIIYWNIEEQILCQCCSGTMN